MFRLMFAPFTFLLSWILDSDSGGGGGNDGPPPEPEKHTLTEEELTQRTNAAGSAASEAERKRVAEILGIDPEKFEDAKGLIEAGKTAQKPPEKPEGEKTDIEKFEEMVSGLKTQFDEFTNKQTQREQQEQQQAEQTRRSEKLTTALTDAGASKEKMEDVARYAGTFDMSVSDKGELEGSKEAVEAAKKAFPDAFRGEGDTGRAADASGQQKGGRKPKNLGEALAAHYQK